MQISSHPSRELAQTSYRNALARYGSIISGKGVNIAAADIPAPFQGNAIGLITAGLMALAFMGFSGLVKY